MSTALPVLRRMLVACSQRRLDCEMFVDLKFIFVTWKWHHFGTHTCLDDELWVYLFYGCICFASSAVKNKTKVKRWNPTEDMRSLRNSQQFQMLFGCSDCRCWGWLDILSKHQRLRKGKGKQQRSTQTQGAVPTNNMMCGFSIYCVASCLYR